MRCFLQHNVALLGMSTTHSITIKSVTDIISQYWPVTDHTYQYRHQ